LCSQCGVRRAAQLQESLTEEKAQVQQLKMSNMKLQDDIQMKNKWQHLLEVKIDALEEEGAKLKAEVVTFFMLHSCKTLAQLMHFFWHVVVPMSLLCLKK
jgi:hypothetical protein